MLTFGFSRLVSAQNQHKRDLQTKRQQTLNGVLEISSAKCDLEQGKLANEN
jgi:hypothetical protein